MKCRLVVLMVAIMLAFASGLVYQDQFKSGAAPKPEDDFQLVKVADGVYAAIAKSGGLASGNAGFIIGDDGVLIFDTFLTPAAIEELIGVIEAQTKLPIKIRGQQSLSPRSYRRQSSAGGAWSAHSCPRQCDALGDD